MLSLRAFSICAEVGFSDSRRGTLVVVKYTYGIVIHSQYSKA